ncbi:MAG: hypothetical protein AAFP77_20765 [Bacteroidota bacterium]
MATIPFQAANNAAEVARSFVISEISAVPGGSLVDRGANITPSVISVIGRSIEILGAPPLADAQLLTRATSSDGQEFNLVRQDRYRSSDSTVILDMNSAQSLNGVGFLLLRLLHTQEVLGMLLDFSSGYPSELDFSAFAPTERRTLNIDWPVSSFDHLLALNYVDNLSSQQQIYLGTGYGSNSLTINLPSDAEGPFVVTASWSIWDIGADFEVQYVYEHWPKEVTFAPIVAGQIDGFRYPEIDIDVELADIVMLEGEVRNTQQNEFCSRQYIGPTNDGEQTLRLPALSPVFMNLGGSLPSLYERAYTEGSQLSFLYYPAMQGSYRWYLTNIYNKGSNSGNWLETLEYERVSIEL